MEVRTDRAEEIGFCVELKWNTAEFDHYLSQLLKQRSVVGCLYLYELFRVVQHLGFVVLQPLRGLKLSVLLHYGQFSHHFLGVLHVVLRNCPSSFEKLSQMLP